MNDEAMTFRLKPLLAELQTLLSRIDRMEGVDESWPRTEAYPPASEADIAVAEERLNFKFPPSYRAFLKLHNGWRGFFGDFFVFGASGPGYTEPAGQLKRDVEMFNQNFEREGTQYANELKDREKTNPDVIYMPHHPPLATDFNGEYLVFDRNRPTGGGEYQIAWVTHGEYVDQRFRDMVQVVEDTIRRARTEIEYLKSVPEAAEAQAGTAPEQPPLAMPAPRPEPAPALEPKAKAAPKPKMKAQRPKKKKPAAKKAKKAAKKKPAAKKKKPVAKKAKKAAKKKKPAAKKSKKTAKKKKPAAKKARGKK